MSNADDAYDPEDRHICHACSGEEYLSDRIKLTGTAVECAYCGEIDMCWTIEDLSVEAQDSPVGRADSRLGNASSSRGPQEGKR